MNDLNKMADDVDAMSEEDLLKCYVEPHQVVSRPVTVDDLGRVFATGLIMYRLCSVKHGFYPGALAIAHQQITADDPLCFFVTSTGEIVINPVITRHSDTLLYKEEACLSFEWNTPIKVGRFYKIEAEYQTLDEEAIEQNVLKFKEGKTIAKLKGLEAKFYQHELSHFTCDYIYPLNAVVKQEEPVATA